jgi:hypothetical protein
MNEEQTTTTTTETTAETTEEKLQLLIEQDVQQHTEVMQQDVQQHAETMQVLFEISQKLDEILQQAENGDSAVNSDTASILQKLDSIIEAQNDLIVGANTVTTYGVLYIPLAIVVFLLWRFFATFLKTYR